jgi:hypothetical protein
MTIEQDESLSEAIATIRKILMQNPVYTGDIKLQYKDGIMKYIDWRTSKVIENLKCNIKKN